MLTHVKTERIRHHGASLEITLSPEICEFLNVGEGDKISLLTYDEYEMVILIKAERLKGEIQGFKEFRFGFSIPENIIKEITKRKVKKTRKNTKSKDG